MNYFYLQNISFDWRSILGIFSIIYFFAKNIKKSENISIETILKKLQDGKNYLTFQELKSLWPNQQILLEDLEKYFYKDQKNLYGKLIQEGKKFLKNNKNAK